MVEITIVKMDGETSRSSSSIESIYTNIGRETEPHIINQYLRTICSYEMDTLSTIRDNNDQIWSNFITRNYLLMKGYRKKERVINITIDYVSKILSDLKSILDMDTEFLTRIDIYTNIRAHILSHDGIYIGHLYTWESDDILYVDAIRSSIQNILDRSRGEGIKGVISLLVDSSIKIARLVDEDIVRVRDPYPITRHVLDTLGFDTDHTFPVERPIPSNSDKYRLIILIE